ncbi:MAG: MFS transporter [Egibacteraceae bacterium]
MTAPSTSTTRSTAAGFGRRFHHLWAASAASNLADGVILLAAPLLAIQLTRSPALVAGVTVAFTLPQTVAAVPAGVLADRAPRARVIAVANLLRMVAAGGLVAAAGTGGLTLAILYAGVALIGAAEMTADTTTHAAIPQVVERGRLAAANSRIQGTQIALNDFVGAPLAGLLVATAAVAALALPAVLFGLAALLVLRVATPRPGSSLRGDVVEGIAFMWRSHLVRDLAVAAAVCNLASTAFFSVLVLHAVAPGPMGLDESAYGLLIAAVALGAIGGAVLAERLERLLGLAVIFRAGVALGAAVFALPIATSQAWALGGAFVVLGAVGMCLNVALACLRQLLIPDALLGRVTGAARLIAMGSVPLGGVIGGVIGSSAGLPAVFAFASLTLLAALVFLRRVTSEVVAAARRTAEDQPADSARTPRPDRRGTPPAATGTS